MLELSPPLPILLLLHVAGLSRLNTIIVPDSSPFEAEIAIAKLKRYKSPGSDQIPQK
jgi:hypothetical protein